MPDMTSPHDQGRDGVDELDRMRRANPVPPAQADSLSQSPQARSLLEELTMTTTDRPARHTTLVLVALVAVVAVAIGVTVAIDSDPALDDPAPVATDDPPLATSGGMAGCVATYSLETLAQREIAFVGTITGIDGDQLGFDVEATYRGDVGDTVTLGGAQMLTGITPDTLPPVQAGDRLLVAGDGGFAWGCGFTQPYDDDVAADWRATLDS